MTTVPDDEDEVQEAEPMSTPQLVLSISGWIWLWFAIVVAIWSAGIGWFLSLSLTLWMIGLLIVIGVELRENFEANNRGSKPELYRSRDYGSYYH